MSRIKLSGIAAPINELDRAILKKSYFTLAECSVAFHYLPAGVLLRTTCTRIELEVRFVLEDQAHLNVVRAGLSCVRGPARRLSAARSALCFLSVRLVVHDVHQPLRVCPMSMWPVVTPSRARVHVIEKPRPSQMTGGLCAFLARWLRVATLVERAHCGTIREDDCHEQARIRWDARSLRLPFKNPFNVSRMARQDSSLGQFTGMLVTINSESDDD